MGSGGVVEETFVEDAFVGGVLVDNQEAGGHDADDVGAHELEAGCVGRGVELGGGGAVGRERE